MTASGAGGWLDPTVHMATLSVLERAINRALRLNRVPSIETRILSALDREGLLGKQIFVVGTNALFAYELMAGVLISGDLLATKDIDLL